MIFSLFKGTPNHEKWVLSCLEENWARLLGERLAAACRPARLAGRDLSIEVFEREWQPALESVKVELLERLRAATGGEVRAITLARAQTAGGR